MSSSLSSAAQDRKSRLAHLKSLKNKQPSQAEKQDTLSSDDSAKQLKRKKSNGDEDGDDDGDDQDETDISSIYLSGRNYDASTKGPKLGFETAPAAEQDTLERRAADLASTAQAAASKQEVEGKPLDLTSLQPKKPNWDLKRDLNRKLEILNPRTQNAISKLVRERIANAKQQQEKAQQNKATTAGGEAKTNGKAQSGKSSTTAEDDDDAVEGQTIGIEGTALVEATKEREREDKEDDEREREYENDLTADTT